MTRRLPSTSWYFICVSLSRVATRTAPVDAGPRHEPGVLAHRGQRRWARLLVEVHTAVPLLAVERKHDSRAPRTRRRGVLRVVAGGQRARRAAIGPLDPDTQDVRIQRAARVVEVQVCIRRGVSCGPLAVRDR